MSIIFFGTTDFSAQLLESILNARHVVELVVTLDDMPAIRGGRTIPTPVKKFALRNSLPLIQVKSPKEPALAERIQSLKAKLGVVVAFKILPKAVYDAPELGTINLHPSLLPKLRGPAPVRWAIINGNTETGVSTFRLVDKPDEGNLLLQEKIAIGPDETWGELNDRIIPLGARILSRTIDGLFANSIKPIPQDHTQATKAPKITKDTTIIDWSKTAEEIHNLIRGLAPKPAAVTKYENLPIKILRTKLSNGNGAPGEILLSDARSGLIVACGKGAIEITQLQASGKKLMFTSDYLRGNVLPLGMKLK